MDQKTDGAGGVSELRNFLFYLAQCNLGRNLKKKFYFLYPKLKLQKGREVPLVGKFTTVVLAVVQGD